MSLSDIIYSLFANPAFLTAFLEIHQNYSNTTTADRIEKGIAQERLISEYSPLIQQEFTSAEYNACYGDLKYMLINIDVKVGQGDYAGAISRESLEKFSKSPVHYYLCTDASFSRVYLINASKLARIKNIQKIINTQGWIGEKDYSYLKTAGNWIRYFTR